MPPKAKKQLKQKQKQTQKQSVIVNVNTGRRVSTRSQPSKSSPIQQQPQIVPVVRTMYLTQPPMSSFGTSNQPADRIGAVLREELRENRLLMQEQNKNLQQLADKVATVQAPVPVTVPVTEPAPEPAPAPAPAPEPSFETKLLDMLAKQEEEAKKERKARYEQRARAQEPFTPVAKQLFSSQPEITNFEAELKTPEPAQEPAPEPTPEPTQKTRLKPIKKKKPKVIVEDEGEQIVVRGNETAYESIANEPLTAYMKPKRKYNIDPNKPRVGCAFCNRQMLAENLDEHIRKKHPDKIAEQNPVMYSSPSTNVRTIQDYV